VLVAGGIISGLAADLGVDPVDQLALLVKLRYEAEGQSDAEVLAAANAVATIRKPLKLGRPIPTTKEIGLFFHCKQCSPLTPSGLSPAEWSKIEVGFTELGIQVWCRRCESNIVHVDFQGQSHPANTST
jgi:hypothetical protein